MQKRPKATGQRFIRSSWCDNANLKGTIRCQTPGHRTWPVIIFLYHRHHARSGFITYVCLVVNYTRHNRARYIREARNLIDSYPCFCRHLELKYTIGNRGRTLKVGRNLEQSKPKGMPLYGITGSRFIDITHIYVMLLLIKTTQK